MSSNTTDSKIHFPLRMKVAFELEHPSIQRLLLLVILGNCVMIAYTFMGNVDVESQLALLRFSHWIVIAFGIEIGLKIYAHGWRFFRNVWNLFDIVVVFLALYPPFVIFAVLRIVRVLKCLELVSEFQYGAIILRTFKITSSTTLSALLLLIVIYFTYNLLGYAIYESVAPQYYGNYGISALTTLHALLEGWPSDIIDLIAEKDGTANIYFASFFVLTRLIFILVILNFTVALFDCVQSKHSRSIIREISLGAESPTKE